MQKEDVHRRLSPVRQAAQQVDGNTGRAVNCHEVTSSSPAPTSETCQTTASPRIRSKPPQTSTFFKAHRCQQDKEILNTAHSDKGGMKSSKDIIEDIFIPFEEEFATTTTNIKLNDAASGFVIVMAVSVHDAYQTYLKFLKVQMAHHRRRDEADAGTTLGIPITMAQMRQKRRL